MRIVVVTSKLPYPATGADEQDRFEGMTLLTELGHDVSVIAKIASYQTVDRADEMARVLTIPVRTVPYTASFRPSRLTDFRWIDGAAFEYTDPELHRALEASLRARPDCVWIDGSFGWPVIEHIHHHMIPVIVRSLQIESEHILVDEGRSLTNYVRAFGKSLGERTMARSADCVVALNKNEEAWYRAHGAKKTVTVPLRYLPAVLEDGPVVYRPGEPVHVLFSASTFSVQHNRDGARRVITEIAPALERALPGAYLIHVTGAKLPDDIIRSMPRNVVYEGYVKDYTTFVKRMDINLTLALGTVGMHGKLFEPLARGIPTIAMPYALAGFPFVDGESILFGEDTETVLRHLRALQDPTLRARIGVAGRAVAAEHFSREAIKAGIAEALHL